MATTAQLPPRARQVSSTRRRKAVCESDRPVRMSPAVATLATTSADATPVDRARVKQAQVLVAGSRVFAEALVRSGLDDAVDWSILVFKRTPGGDVHTVIARATYRLPLPLPSAATVVVASSSPATEERRVLAIKLIDTAHRGEEFGLSAVEMRQREWRTNRALAGCAHVLTLDEQHWYGTACLSVCRFVGDGDLLVHLRLAQGVCMPEDKVRRIFSQLMTGVAEMHTRSYAHRDIKLENVFYDAATEETMLGDLEFACNLHADRTSAGVFQARCGSQAYACPEMWISWYTNRAGATDEHKLAGDIWSCGVVLYCMLFDRFPYDILGAIRRSRRRSMIRDVLECLVTQLPDSAGLERLDNGTNRLDFPDGVSDSCKDLIGAMLHLDPSRRIDVIDVLTHPWMIGSADAARPMAVTRSLPALATSGATARERPAPPPPAHPIIHSPVTLAPGTILPMVSTDSASQFVLSFS